MAVSPATDEQQPVWPTKEETTFPSATATFLVEIKNVGEKQGAAARFTLWRERIAALARQKCFGSFCSVYFRLRVHRPGCHAVTAKVHMFDTDIAMSAAAAGPRRLLRQVAGDVNSPAHWDLGIAHLLAPGEYQLRAHYRGLPDGAMAKLKEMEALRKALSSRSDLLNEWTGDVATGSVSFVIAGQSDVKRPEPIWGQPVDGLRAAVEFRTSAASAQAQRDNVAGTFPLGSQVVADLLLQNVSDHNIPFWSETSRQDDRIFQVDETGKETELHHARYSGWARMNHWELKPQQIAVLPGIGPRSRAKLATMNNFQHPVGPVIGGMPGTYSLRYELRFGGMQRTDKDGKTVIPGEGDWKGTLSTGIAKLEAHDRTPADDPPTFAGRLEIRDVDGKPVSRTFVRASQAGGKPLFEGDAVSATVEIPGCTDAALSVYVRAQGYEETQFYDIVPKLNQKIPLTVKRCSPCV